MNDYLELLYKIINNLQLENKKLKSDLLVLDNALYAAKQKLVGDKFNREYECENKE
jgi:hypothetical protein